MQLFEANAILCNNDRDGGNTMEAKDSHGFNQIVEENDKSVDRAWVKPTLERLSLKRGS